MNNRPLYVVVACEESQRVTMAFRKLGHFAYSVDLKPCSGGHPEYHFQDDAFKIIDLIKPDIVIAHPPCTFLSKVSSVALSKGYHDMNSVSAAREFFMRFLDLPCKVAIENPVPAKFAQLPPASQYIQPYMFGDDYTKLTGLWLKGLPELLPNCYLDGHKSHATGFPSWVASVHSAELRSKTFNGIAKAMAEQWGGKVNA